MTRSRKKSPAGGMTLAESEKKDKTIASRQMRRAVKQVVSKASKDVEPEVPLRTGFSNPWSWAKDGRKWWSEHVVARLPRLMRK